jgi:hypothetical protein
MPIKMYNKVHTGANRKLGGLKKGLFRVEYQVGMFGAVKKEPIKPAIKEPIIETINANNSFNFIQ